MDGNNSIPYVDLGLLTFLLFSGVMALRRGFAKEVLQILAWVGATFATIYL